MTPTVICIWVTVFTSSMLCVQTTVKSRYKECRFNVTDLGCPVYDDTDWKCLKHEASCPEGTEYHCLRLHGDHSRYADGCAKSKECSKGEMPYWVLINDWIPTQVICDWCHDIEYFNSEKKVSSTYSHCPDKKVKCHYHNVIECLPENKTDIYKQDRLCRCDARNNYVVGDLKRLKGQDCTSDLYLTTYCIQAEPCKDGHERLLNYTCVNKCKNGFRSNTSDECRQFFFIQPTFSQISEPTEKTGEPFPTAQSRNTKETTISSTILSRKTSPKSEVIQTTTKPVEGGSTLISAIVLVICASLVLLIGIGIRIGTCLKGKGTRLGTDDELDPLSPKLPHTTSDTKHHSNVHNRMAESNEILYSNWIKAGLGLKYVKEGIQDFIVEEINNFHRNVLVSLPGAGRCTNHTIHNVLKCPTYGICSDRPCRFHDNTDPRKTYTPCLICEAIRHKIEIAHRYCQPSYKNTRSKLWCTASWELAKCFMADQGYFDKNTAEDTDLTGLISVILNNKDFQNKITEILGEPGNKFEKVREARTAITNNAKMEIFTTDLNSYLKILNDVLNDTKHLQGLTKVKCAKKKLLQLQTNRITITYEDVNEESLKASEGKTEECIYEIDKKKDEIVQEIDKKKDECIQANQDKEYKRKTNELKEEIVDHYIDNGYCVSSIPVLEQGDKALVDDFFMMPEMKRVKPATNESNVNTKSSDSISSIHGLFLKDKQRIRRVCIVGEAGRGKTTLCQKMISSWCTIHKNKETATDSEPANRSFDKDDEQFLKSIKFLFYIPLRNHKTSTVVEMIKYDLVRKGLHDLLDEVLSKESDSCLFILDGLDEWTAEKDYTGTLPNLDPREKFSVIITTRPWKLEVLRPKQPDIGQEIELNGISNRNLFVGNVLKVLDRKLHKENKTSDAFFYHIRTNKMTNLIGISLICTQLICMWYDDLLDCCYTQTEIYFEMIEYLFDVAARRQQKPYQTVIPDSQVSIKHSSVHPLHIFKGRTHCQKYGQLLVNLSELAYSTLFKEERENALVFKHSLSEIHNLTEIDVQFCLKVGLLSQAKYCNKVTSPSKKLSFLHKTFQELLAAMHIANFDDDSLMSMLQTFKCLNDVHEMAQVLIFLSGMRPDCVGALSRQIAELADEDKEVLTERQSLCLGSHFLLRDRTLTIQSVLSDCINEGYRDGKFPDELVVHDIDLLKDDVFTVNVKSVLQCLNATKIKSLSVDSEMLKDIDGQTRNIVKLRVTNVSSQRRVIDLTSLIKGCVSSLACLHVEGRGSSDTYVNMDDFISTIHTLNHITCIGLAKIDLSHSNIENLAKYLSGSTQLREIMLGFIRCTSCEQNQCFYKIDLLRHKTLNYLNLNDLDGHVEIGQGIPLTECELYSANIGMSFVECLENSTSLQELVLGDIYYPLVDVETNSSIYTVYQKMLGVVLPTLKNLRYLYLWDFDCGQELLNCSQLTSLKEIDLYSVTMTLECVQCLVDSLSQTNNEIEIVMYCVTVNPKYDLSAVKEYILDKWGIGFFEEDGDTGIFTIFKTINFSRTLYVQTDSED